MKIYAIIVTYNAMRRNWADRCLKSLQNSTTPVTAVIIDNGSTDGTREYIPKHYPDAIWLPQEKNLGFGQANNVGFRYALEHEADYVLLLNQDASIAPDMLSKLIKESDGLSLVTPIHCNGDGSSFDANFEKYTLRPCPHAPQTLSDCKQTTGSYEIGEVCAACWLMPIRLVNTIGGFNPLFFQYSEDNNYYDRMAYHHIKTLLVPAVEMHHDRLTHGSEKTYSHKLLHRSLLTILCDINLSMTSCIKEVLWKTKNCYTQELKKGAYMPGSIFIELLWFAAHSNTIRKSRKKERQKGRTWL
ncbi:MAG: glycosyltransferase family 2 protein [Prevotella sp.]|nr:glycosyltransferase family 2 protein [Prevotella sp.]